MSLKRIMLTILVFLSLAPHSNAQEPKPNNASDKAVVQPLVLSASPARSHRNILTLKYAPIFYSNARQSRPAVIGTFPNHQQARFLVDSGTDGIILSENLVRDLGLMPITDINPPPNALTFKGKPLKLFNLPDFDMASSTASSPLSNSNWLGHLKFNSTAVVIPQKDTTYFGADGIFGTSFLNTVGATLFDGPKQEFVFILGGNLTVKEREELDFSNVAAAITLAPIKTSTNGLFTVPVTFENKGVSENETLLVDTGSDTTTLPRVAALALQLQSTAYTPS